MKRIAIVGSGFFGLSLAIKLSKKFSVEVFEKKDAILSGASKANQLRYHLGYHYPRSFKTLKEVQNMHRSFEKFLEKQSLVKQITIMELLEKKLRQLLMNTLIF